MRLAAHLGSLERDNIENHAIGGKKHVEIALEVVFGQFVGEVPDI